jgi:fumarate reductase flavoprotein subunit
MTGIRNKRLQCDVVVVGVGFAGIAAILEASKIGASVIALGRKNPLASNSAKSAGGFILADTPLQRANGIHDSADLLAQDILNANHHSLPKDLVMAAAREATELYDWLTKLGVRFAMVRPLSGHSVPRAHRIGSMGGSHVLKLLFEAVKGTGTKVNLGMTAQHLIVDADNRVEGVQALDEEGEIEIRASKGVVLAAGGFGKNRDMLAQFLPKLSEMFCVGGAGSTGDGIRMGMEIGARSINMDAAVLTPLCSIKRDVTLPGIVEAMIQGAILINKKGQRFVDERKGMFSDTAFPVMLQPDRRALLVFDEDIKKRVKKLEKHMNHYLNKGLLLFGRNADELADRAGIEKKSFRIAVEERYPSGNLYGTWVQSALVMTHGGLMVNPAAQVIHEKGDPIPHLYAAGDNTPGLGGGRTDDRPFPGYIGSGCLWALASGRIAGRNAAEG